MLGRLKELLVGFALVPFLIQPVFAHTVWFEYKDGEYQLVFGHPEEGSEPYDPTKFRGVTAYDINKQLVPVKIDQQEDPVTIAPDGEFAALTAFLDNGFYVQKSEDNFEEVSQAEAQIYNPDYEVGHYVKSTKALYDWSEPLSQPFGLPLEIMPLQNPSGLTAGETLPIQVLYQGNLVKDVLVEYEGKTLALDENGIASVLVGEGGLQPIEASYASALNNDLAADTIEHATTLTANPVPEPSTLLGLSAFGLLTFLRKGKLKRKD
ncbi:DUF4198 domain-containing protein [Aliterella atlantica]